jgi:hypothetical protein
VSEETGFIIKFYDKAYENHGLIDLVNAPVASISGVSESDGRKLLKAFNIKTVGDFARNKYIALAQAVTDFSECSGQILNKEFQGGFINLLDKPVNAIKGISEGDAVLLNEAFNIKTVKDLARNKYVEVAQTTLTLASLLEILKEMEQEIH